MSHWCDLDLEVSTLIFLRDTLAHDDACIIKPSYVTRCSEDASWTFIHILNLCCNLDPEHSNPIFSLHVLAYDFVPLNQVGTKGSAVQKIQQKQSYFGYINLYVTLTVKSAHQPFCLTLSHDYAPPYQIWPQKVKWLRRYYPDQIWTYKVNVLYNTHTPTPHPNSSWEILKKWFLPTWETIFSLF